MLSARNERVWRFGRSLLINTNEAYIHWARFFNIDNTITSAVLDRVLHHAETVIIEGKSYRTREPVDED